MVHEAHVNWPIFYPKARINLADVPLPRNRQVRGDPLGHMTAPGQGPHVGTIQEQAGKIGAAGPPA
jgi:hypothetical protein